MNLTLKNIKRNIARIELMKQKNIIFISLILSSIVQAWSPNFHISLPTKIRMALRSIIYLLKTLNLMVSKIISTVLISLLYRQIMWWNRWRYQRSAD